MPPSDKLIVYRRASAGFARAPIERFARRLREEVAGGRGFECLITDDRELQRLNNQFLGHDYPTDVLSFPDSGESDRAFLGSMAISTVRAAEQARRYGHSVTEEIKILMLHGVLHLLGMDHESDRGRMRRAEAAWRKALELPAGLIERVRT
jgi:probable rRNA maturation factor